MLSFWLRKNSSCVRIKHFCKFISVWTQFIHTLPFLEVISSQLKQYMKCTKITWVKVEWKKKYRWVNAKCFWNQLKTYYGDQHAPMKSWVCLCLWFLMLRQHRTNDKCLRTKLLYNYHLFLTAEFSCVGWSPSGVTKSTDYFLFSVKLFKRL